MVRDRDRARVWDRVRVRVRVRVRLRSPDRNANPTPTPNLIDRARVVEVGVREDDQQLLVPMVQHAPGRYRETQVFCVRFRVRFRVRAVLRSGFGLGCSTRSSASRPSGVRRSAPPLPPLPRATRR